MENKLEEQIKDIMSAVFEIPEEEIKDDSSTDTIESWDSLKHMKLIVALEEELNVIFSDNDIIELDNLKNIFRVLSEKLQDDKL